MKTLIVPKDKSPLEFLIEMESQIINSWVFLRRDVCEKLEQSCERCSNETMVGSCTQWCMKWNANSEHPKVRLSCDVPYGTWGRLSYLKVSNNRYNYYVPMKPDVIYFVELDEID